MMRLMNAQTNGSEAINKCYDIQVEVMTKCLPGGITWVTRKEIGRMQKRGVLGS